MDTAAHRADQEALVRAAQADLKARGIYPSCRAIACRLGPGWSEGLVRRIGVRPIPKPDPVPEPAQPEPAPAPKPAAPPSPPRPAPARPDIAAECARIQEDWTESERARRDCYRAEAVVPTGIDHHQKWFTQKYK